MTIDNFTFYFDVDEVAKNGLIGVPLTVWSDGLLLVYRDEALC